MCFLQTDFNWSGGVWIMVVFLSAVWTFILMAPIHWRESIGDAKFLQICSDEETNSSTSWMSEGE